MGFYDDDKNVETYVQMAEGYDGRELVDVLKKHLPPGSTVLELGMGPGKDLALLAEAFTATGSERSEVFLRRYRRDHPDADVLLLDDEGDSLWLLLRRSSNALSTPVR